MDKLIRAGGVVFRELITFSKVDKNGEYKVSYLKGPNDIFYKVDYRNPQVSEVSFEDLFTDWLLYRDSKLFRDFVKSYVRLFVKSDVERLTGVSFKSVEDGNDLEAIMELYFSQGVALE